MSRGATGRRTPLARVRACGAMAQPNGLPADGLRRGGHGAWKRTEKTTPTDIAAYLWSTLAAEDLRISSETLLMQAQIADGVGRRQLAENFRRAAEMAPMPDDRVLSAYNALRPNASTKQQLLDLADELENEFSAARTAALIREAAEVYERRDLLLAES